MQEGSVYSFFKNHIIMATYGTRCGIYEQLELSLPGVADNKEDDEETAAVRVAVAGINGIVNETIKAIEDKYTEVMNSYENDSIVPVDPVNVLDRLRSSFEQCIQTSRAKIDEIMCSETVRKRLFSVALQRQKRMEAMQKAQQAKPVNEEKK